MADPSHIPDPSRFWQYVEPFTALDACWLWTGRLDRDGYGSFRFHRQGKCLVYAAHRVAYHFLVTPIPEGLVVDHLCRNRACINPDHMDLVTSRVNTQRGFPSGHGKRGNQPTCLRGHEFTPENTRLDRRGYRRCRACDIESGRRWRERNPRP